MVAGIVGAVLGVVAAGLGLGVMLAIPLGFFNRFLRVAPETGAAPIAKGRLLAAILALNDERRPWAYRPTPDDPRTDIVAEWKLADARWWGAFQRNGFRRSYRALVALHEPTGELRIAEETSATSWTVGSEGITPIVRWSHRFFKGVILFERAREAAYGVVDELPPRIGEIYSYDFDPWRVKGPLLRLAVENGWAFAPVVHAFQLGRKADQARRVPR